MNRIFKTIGVNSYILYNKDISDITLYPHILSICLYVDMSIFEGRVIKFRMGGGI